MPKLPDRWIDYNNIGDVVQGTRFVTFKVPLQQSFFSHRVPEDSWFTPSMLLKSTHEKDLNIGLVIDLTFTNRYYNPKEFTDQGVHYEKIFVPGHVIPSQEILDKFYDAVDNFLETSDEGSLVGVHCTHGVNRTGYVVCRYMVDRLGIKATEALSAYGKARGYPVERGNYIHDLKVRSGEASGEYQEADNEKSDKRADKGHRGQDHDNGGIHRGRSHGDQHHGHKDHHQGHKDHHQGRIDHRQGHKDHHQGHKDHNQGHRGQSHRSQSHDHYGGQQNRRGYYDSSYDRYYQNDFVSGWGRPSGGDWSIPRDGQRNQSGSYVSNGRDQYEQRSRICDFRGHNNGGHRGSYNDRHIHSADSLYTNSRDGWKSRNNSDYYYQRQNSDPYCKSYR